MKPLKPDISAAMAAAAAAASGELPMPRFQPVSNPSYRGARDCSYSFAARGGKKPCGMHYT